MAIIYFTERNIRGAWVVYEIIGIKQSCDSLLNHCIVMHDAVYYK